MDPIQKSNRFLKILLGPVFLLGVVLGGSAVFWFVQPKHNNRQQVEKATTTGLPSEMTIQISKKEVVNSDQTFADLMTQLRVVPYFENGEVKGFQIRALRPGTVFTKMGLKRGMIVHKINGEVLTMEKMEQIFQSVMDMSESKGDSTERYEIQAVYSGKPVTIHYEIVE